MSRRVLAPVLLLLAAVCSIAAVFAVHRIEARGGPLSQPSASTFFSPNGDGVQDVADVRFTTRQPERVTVQVIDLDTGERILLRNAARVNGETTVEWDGTTSNGSRASDGEFRFSIRRAGDSRSYSPTKPTVLDTVAPIGILDRATLELGELRGLAMLGPNEKLEVFERGDDKPVKGIRQFAANPASQGAQPSRTPPRDTSPYRFTVPLAGTPLRIDVVDKAGNRRQFVPQRDFEYQANG